MNKYSKLNSKKEEIINDINIFMAKINKEVLYLSNYINMETEKLTNRENNIKVYLKELRNLDAISLRPTLLKVSKLANIDDFYGFNTAYSGNSLGFIKKEKVTGKYSNEKVMVTRDSHGNVISVIKGKSEYIRNFTIIFMEKELLKINKEKNMLLNNLSDIENALKLNK